MENEKTPSERLQEESLKVASVIAQVIHESGRGRRHKFGAYQEVTSPIIKPGASQKQIRLVGVMVPIEIAAGLVEPAGLILQEMEAGDGDRE